MKVSPAEEQIGAAGYVARCGMRVKKLDEGTGKMARVGMGGLPQNRKAQFNVPLLAVV